MKMKFWTLAILAGALSLGACSKKKKGESDEGGDMAAMQPTDLGSAAGSGGVGAAIPELSSVFFEYDSFNLTGEAKTALTAHAGWLKANSSKMVQVEGHCDERGTTEYNLALGERRAAAVRDFLVSKGVASSQLSTISYGEERPAVSGSDESAWSKNRRAVFVNN